ncbi:hypothetical protein TorRG33x02_330010 [Trema orientale]|uniref:Uncharacterized protein n=1 Tax=Trema orientale TaxID=63057 RepID=A0A2P5B820_TREOI|nr:hypothetical protein TorRG33x02_330010 [Trema orientale]
MIHSGCSLEELIHGLGRSSRHRVLANSSQNPVLGHLFHGSLSLSTMSRVGGTLAIVSTHGGEQVARKRWLGLVLIVSGLRQKWRKMREGRLSWISKSTKLP